MQDATLRENNIYRFYLYDRLGRTAVQGLCSGCNRSEEVNIAEFKENVDGICNTGYVFPLSDKITDPNLETVNYYDDYGFLQEYSAGLGNLISDFQVKESCAQGLQTGKVQVASDGEKVIDAFFYDAKGQIVDTRRLIDKRLTCIHTDYSYTGKPVRIVTNEYSVDDGSKSLVVSQIQENTYSKKTDKLLSSTLSVNGKKETIQKFDYDDLGRVKSITRGGNAGAVTYGYNLHGWTTSIDSRDFHEELHYTNGAGTPCYNGNISSQLWSTSDYGQVRGYKFEYDGLDRLKEAVYGETPSLSDKQNRYNEKVMEYTANGAMKRFQRRGRKDNGEYGKIDNLNIKLNGNRLLSVTDDALPANKYSSFNFIDGANEQTEYEYNGVGALTKDLNRGITIKYDNLNNPRRIDFKDGNSITYTHLPDGMLIIKSYGEKQLSPKYKYKVSVLDSLANVSGRMDSADSLFMDNLGMIVTGNTEYSGNIIYRNGKLYKVLFPGGYCTFNKGTSEPIFHYFTQDHLGNNRIVTNEDGTVEQITHYYPFGGTFNDAGLNAGLQQYKYNGKELDRIAGLNTYDYGSRHYFSALPIWDRMDSKCEEDYGISPYGYCRNNPIKNIDNDGKKTILYATTLPGVLWNIEWPTHTFIVVSHNNRTYYFAYGPQGDYLGPLRRVAYDQDKLIYTGVDKEHLKNRIVVEPPKGMSEDDFDKKVINVANSFGNDNDFNYFLFPTREDEGNCNTSSSTILYKAGISKERLNDYRREIKGIVTGFGNIKAWTKDEQKEAIKNQKFKDEKYEKADEKFNYF